MKDSVDGKYLDAIFGSSDTDEGNNKQLQAAVQNIMKDFAPEMSLRGHALHLVDHPLEAGSADNTVPKLIAREDFIKYVKVRMNRNRGRELPGTFNPDIIGELFLNQVEPRRPRAIDEGYGGFNQPS